MMSSSNRSQAALALNALVLAGAFLFTSCAVPQAGVNKTAGTAIAGSALGAGLGAIVGSQSGHTAGGLAVGAAAGALGGALLGNSMEQQDREREQLSNRLAQQQSQLEQNRVLIDELRRRGADVRSSQRGVVINLPDILFQFDRADLTPDARRTIGEISQVLRSVPDRGLSVEGHTDSVGTMQYNKALSLARARSVATELSDHGVPRPQLRTRGFGEGSPIATNNSDAGRARNRRVEVIIENTER